MSRSGFRWSVAAASLCALGLVASLFAANASAQGQALQVQSFAAGVGQVSKVELSVADIGEPGVAAWTVDVQYDPELLTALECESEQGGGICNEHYSANVVRAVGTNIYGLSGDAVLASLGFSCKKPGESSLKISVSVFVDATPGDPQDMDVKMSDGTATCSEKPPEPTPTPTPKEDVKIAGDANCDGHATALDAALVLQFVAGFIDSLVCPDADYNHDSDVDALDAALILQKDAGLID